MFQLSGFYYTLKTCNFDAQLCWPCEVRVGIHLLKPRFSLGRASPDSVYEKQKAIGEES